MMFVYVFSCQYSQNKNEIIQNKKQKKIFTLDSKKRAGITVFVRNWVKIEFKSKENLVLVLCSHDYDKKDYINDFKKL